MVEAESKEECEKYVDSVIDVIKAKGFEDCMVYLEDDKIDVLVKCDGMTDSEAAQIKDVILGAVDVEDKNISIIEIK